MLTVKNFGATVGSALASAVLLLALSGPASASNYMERNEYGYDSPALHIAYDCGLEDGAEVARQDLFRGKAFQPYPRGKYAHEDRGYRNDYGDKYAYRESYADGYRKGYERAYRRY